MIPIRIPKVSNGGSRQHSTVSVIIDLGTFPGIRCGAVALWRQLGDAER